MLTSHPMFWVCFVLCSVVCVSSTKMSAFNLGMLAESSRYPVGYNPDNRTRPNYKPLPDLRTPDMWAGESACSPMLQPRPKWEPPVGYDPKKRKLAFVDLRTPKTDEVLETINFENMHDADGRLKLCTGIWMGNKILEKRCVWLDD